MASTGGAAQGRGAGLAPHLSVEVALCARKDGVKSDGRPILLTRPDTPMRKFRAAAACETA